MNEHLDAIKSSNHQFLDASTARIERWGVIDAHSRIVVPIPGVGRIEITDALSLRTPTVGCRAKVVALDADGEALVNDGTDTPEETAELVQEILATWGRW